MRYEFDVLENLDLNLYLSGTCFVFGREEGYKAAAGPSSGKHWRVAKSSTTYIQRGLVMAGMEQF